MYTVAYLYRTNFPPREVHHMKPILAILATLLVVACTAAPPTEQSTDTTPPVEEEITPPPKEETPPAPADARGAFAAALSATEFKVTYKVTADISDVESVSTMTQYVKGLAANYRARTDISAQGVEIRTFVDGETITSCTKFGGVWSCRNSEMQQGQNPTGDARDAADSAQEVERDGTKVVAGVTTDCYKVTTDGGTVRYCIGQGVPLYIETLTEQGTSVVEATSFTRTVSDADFEPPATPSSGSATGMPAGFDPNDYR
jgi:hypothetical protein